MESILVVQYSVTKINDIIMKSSENFKNWQNLSKIKTYFLQHFQVWDE